MKILITCKQVPDPDIKIKLNSDGTGINTDGLKYVVNPFDEIANEEALRIKEKLGGEVVVCGIGAKDISTQIRSCLAMGSDKGVHVLTDETVDPNTVADILVKVVEKEQPDIILMGKQAVDDDLSQTAQILSAKLAYPQAVYASKIDVEDGKAVVVREVDGGLETVEVALPSVITADLRLNEPRYASLPNIMKAKRKPIDEYSLDDLGIALSCKVKMVKMTAPEERKAGVMVSSVDELVDKLVNEAKVV